MKKMLKVNEAMGETSLKINYAVINLTLKSKMSIQDAILADTIKGWKKL